MEYIQIRVIAASVYKILTTEVGDPEIVEPAKNNLFFGDDNYTFITEQDGVNRSQPIASSAVAESLFHVSINNALFEANPEQILDFNLPGMCL